MHLLFGDSHVASLAPHMGPRFHCESQPGWTSERALRESDWTLEVALQEDAYESCTLLLGANDAQQLRTSETVENLRALKRIAERHVGRVWIMGYPGMEHPEEFTRAFGDAFVPVAIKPGADGVHADALGAARWARAVQKIVK